MRVLVPGGCGYIGAWLVPHLLADGHKVTVFDPQWFGDGHMPDNGSLRVIDGDIRNDSFAKACEKKDAMILLASMSSNAMCEKYPYVSRQINVKATAWAVATARAQGVKRIIYASSVAAYGSMERDAVEDDPLNPTTLYGQQKKEAEEAVRAEYGPTTIVRSASVCGDSPRMRFDVTINRMVRDAATTGLITVNGGGQKRCHVNIWDLSDFYKLLLKTPINKVAGQTFNVVAENQTVLESANIVAEHLKYPIRNPKFIKIKMSESTDDRSYTVNGDKARKVLGWKPKRTVADAVARLGVAFNFSQDLSAPRYMNMADVV